MSFQEIASHPRNRELHSSSMSDLAPVFVPDNSNTSSFPSIQIVTYNVLSSSLSSPGYYTHCDPRYLDPVNRLVKIKAKLKQKIQDKAIICLQEVSLLWSDNLHTFFLAHGYYMINTHYGSKFTGYMGIAIAFPMDTFTLVDSNITCIGDLRCLPTNKTRSCTGSCLKTVRSIIGISLNDDNNDEAWTQALKRTNRMMCARFVRKSASTASPTPNPFVVGTYHMPCAFKTPAIMVIHSALSAQNIHKYAQGDPYVFAGDFNIPPRTVDPRRLSIYQFLVTGKFETKEDGLLHEDMPTSLRDHVKTDLKIIPLRSAYAVAHGKEPDFTNYSRVRNDKPFIDTLDYIFLSEQWCVHSTEPLVKYADIFVDKDNNPMPNQSQPSDHLMLGAVIEL